MKAARTEQPAAHAGDKCENQYLLSGVRSRFKVMLLSRAQISGEAVYGANQVADQFHRSKKTSSGLAPGLQSFANRILTSCVLAIPRRFLRQGARAAHG